MTCGNCTTNPMIVPNNMIYLANINIDDLENNFSIINTLTQENMRRNIDEIEDSNICGISDVLVPCNISLNTSNFEYENETLPDSDEFFDENQEIKFDSLEKKYSIEDGDLKFCPPTWIRKVKKLLYEYKDRFSTFKLDVEVTDMYTADLETIPGEKVIQKCRRLPHHMFQFGLKAIKQLEKARVVRESDSEWQSNVVMIPKPISATQLGAVTKADMQSGKQNKAELYCLCPDFRDLNKILVFPKQSQFTTLDKFLYTLNPNPPDGGA